MMRLTLSLATAAVLAGCSVVPQSAWTFDPTHPQPRPVADAAAVAPLTNEVAGLQKELNDVRAKVAEQPDATHRLPLYSPEHRVGMRLSRAQRELAEYAQAR